jgi:hypothetical protein
MDANSLLDFISRLYARAILLLQGEGQLDITLFGVMVCVGSAALLLVFMIVRIVATPPAANTVVVPPPVNNAAVPWGAFVVFMALLGIGFIMLYLFSSS